MAFHIGKNCRIDPTAVIDVKEGYLGEGAIVSAFARIEGYRVEIGREAFLDRMAVIGGGSCFDPCAYLCAGDWLHMGLNSQINVARGVKVGHEFGCGIETKVFTHGAYIDAYNLGAPVQWEKVEIGDNVWLPNAWVNPGVKIGSNVVIAARSLVNRDIPSGALAGGVPVKVLKENWLPREVSQADRLKLLQDIVAAAWLRYYGTKADENAPVTFDNALILSKENSLETVFDVKTKTIVGPATPWTLVLKDQLRRNGIRFRYKVADGIFTEWRSGVWEI